MIDMETGHRASTSVTALETHLSEQLREVALREVESRGLIADENLLAEALHLFPSGARRLMNQSRWSVDTGLRVLSALGVDLHVESASR